MRSLLLRWLAWGMKRRLEPVVDLAVRGDLTVAELAAQMRRGGGFTAKKLGVAAELLRQMFSDRVCTTFLSFPACVVATGTRGVLRDLVREGLVDVIITTCGTLDHDLARVWEGYYHGEFEMDDAALHRRGINRLGNILIPNASYGVTLEEHLQPIFKELYAQGTRSLSTRELCTEVGQRLRSRGSILYWAAKNDIPIFVPGITDGAVGSQLWLFQQRHRDLALDLFKDQQELAELVFKAERSGALMIGGGISKHHTIWWNQFREGLDYVVYLTTAEEYDGSLSGARVREAISWGKVREDAKHVTVEGDATITLPVLVAAAMAGRRRARKS